MPPIRNTTDDELLDAARETLLAVGWRRTTLTDVARRAGVSRMTLYRKWPDMVSLLGDLMTREWSPILAASVDGATACERLVGSVRETVGALRENPLFRKIVDVDPELLLPYLLDRRGRTQEAVLSRVEAVIVEGQQDGSVRDGDPLVLARSLLLAAHGFTLSAVTMTDPSGPSVADLDAQLGRLVDCYLAP